MCLENAVIHLQSHKEDQTAVAGIQEKQYNEGGKMINRHCKEKKQRTHALLERIQNDPELTQKLLSQYGI